MRFTCGRCQTVYVDPSTAAAAEPRGCPWCSGIKVAPGLLTVSREAFDQAIRAIEAAAGEPLTVTFEELKPFGVVSVRLGEDFWRLLTKEKFEEIKRHLEAPPHDDRKKTS